MESYRALLSSSFHRTFSQPHTYIPFLDLGPELEKSFTGRLFLPTAHKHFDLLLKVIATQVMMLPTEINKYLLNSSMIDVLGNTGQRHSWPVPCYQEIYDPVKNKRCLPPLRKNRCLPVKKTTHTTDGLGFGTNKPWPFHDMVGWHHRLDGHEFEQAPGVGDGQGSLERCGPRGCKELNKTERLNTSVSSFYNVVNNTYPVVWL